MVAMTPQLTPSQEQPGRATAKLPGRAGAPVANEARIQSIITQTVEQAVIPRLLLTRRDDTMPVALARRVASSPVSSEHVAELVAMVVARDEIGAIGFVEAMHLGGIPAEVLYLDLLAPTARHLGQMWTNDDCDFTDVTVGLFLLQSALRELGSTFQSNQANDATAPRALLVPLPGAQHTFGLCMVFDFFRRAGWNAWSGPIDSDEELAAMMRDSWYDVVGFSLACDEQLQEAAVAIRLVRQASRNPDIAVMVGGPGFASNPALAALVGADGTAVDGRQAVQQANALLALAASRRCS